jgi:hypothetical protein
MLTKDEARRIAVNKAGLGHLALLDLASGSLQPIQTEFTEVGSLRANGNRVVFRGGASSSPHVHRRARSTEIEALANANRSRTFCAAPSHSAPQH